jgi:WD40 repeat protein
VAGYIAAGADGRVCLWDARLPGGGGRRAGSFDDTHDGDVTALAAAPAGPATPPGLRAPLISAGVDGLVAVWDLSAGTLEDDAFVVRANSSPPPPPSLALLCLV